MARKSDVTSLIHSVHPFSSLTYARARTHNTQTHQYTHTPTHTHSHTDPPIHTQTHPHIHTHTHTVGTNIFTLNGIRIRYRNNQAASELPNSPHGHWGQQ